MGAPAARYSGKLVSGSAFQYEIQVPSPNGEFEFYSAVAAPGTGICKVAGVGRTHRNDDYGVEVRNAFSNLTALLDEKYGKAQQFDFIRTGALWNEPREWVWSVYKHERTLASFWTLERGSPLPLNVEAVALEAKSVNPSSGAYLTLSYEFSNFRKCKEIMDRADDTGL